LSEERDGRQSRDMTLVFRIADRNVRCRHVRGFIV